MPRKNCVGKLSASQRPEEEPLHPPGMKCKENAEAEMLLAGVVVCVVLCWAHSFASGSHLLSVVALGLKEEAGLCFQGNHKTPNRQGFC